jgi:hypothetical protein
MSRLASAALFVTAVVAGAGAVFGGDGLFGVALVWLALSALWMSACCLGAAATPHRPRPIREPDHDAQWWRDEGCPHTADLIEQGHLTWER